MTELHTPRLRLVPLTPAQLMVWTDRCEALARELGCRFVSGPLPAEFRSIVLGQRELALSDPVHLPLCTFWLLITLSEGIVVGSACFKGPPDTSGTVEIGYGLERGQEKRGYMTEAAGALCRWSLALPDVVSVTAETEPDNLASQRVLQRVGFRPCGPEMPGWWVLTA